MNVDTPIPIGYFLRRVGVTLASWPAASYRGIDRAPFVPDPTAVEWSNLWSEYLVTRDDEVQFSEREALRFQSEFLVAGEEYEVIFCELAGLPVEQEPKRL